ncbi:Hint domain-containing protein [Litorisediminicola beolgyonensis]|uniref:Hint domain-containing protein n=1 Tax=Litorisediminicola beolgyonensis TaxID=1173614 RepID=A0ABW3ZLV7_9RHOB
MATNFEVIYLGQLSIIDTTQGNEFAENPNAILGTYGSWSDGLYNHVHDLTPERLTEDDNNTYDTDNGGGYDSFRIDGGAAQNFDVVVTYNATITYIDGTTATITAVIFQDVTGKTYLAPEITNNADQAALTAKPIQTLSLNSVEINSGDMGADRVAGNFLEAVDGTTGNDSMGVGYTDSNGDSITSGADVIDGGAGNDTINAGGGNDTIIAGKGNDTITGGAGTDTVIFKGAPGEYVFDYGPSGELIVVDTVADRDGTDRLIGVERAIFNGTTYELVLGTDGNDTLQGTNDGIADLVIGHDGADSLVGNGTNDVLVGGAGNDTIFTGDGNDTVYGGTGNDSIGSYGGTDNGNDLIYGEDGNDTIIGGGGNDTIYGGTGDDVLAGHFGSDTLYGGDGSDTFTITDDHEYDEIYGGEGGTDFDIIAFSTWSATQGVTVNFTGNEAGNYDFDGTAGFGNFSQIEAITGTSYGDTFNASSTTSGTVLYGLEGNDTITGGSGADYIDGGIGNDTLVAGGGADTVVGGEGNDSIQGRAGNDSLRGDAGNDTIDGGAGVDTIEGGTGDDLLVDTGTEADLISGGDGNDQILSGQGNDTIDGGTGDDTLRGNEGDDLVTGGDGNDLFVYVAGDGNDTITDFNFGNTGTISDGNATNNDRIDLSAFYDNVWEIHADQADDGILNQSNTTTLGGRAVDYSDNASFGTGSLTFTSASANNSSYTAENTMVACLVRGTRIRTPEGERAVEDLREGDLVETRDHGPQPIRWISRTVYQRADLESNPRRCPVLLRKGSFGATRDLWVSPQHCMLIEDEDGEPLFLRATHLTSTPLARVAAGCKKVSYFHLLFDCHEVIFAEGAQTESFYPGPQAVGALSAPDREGLFAKVPRLRTHRAEQAFGPRAARVATRKAAIRIGRDIASRPCVPPTRPVLALV